MSWPRLSLQHHPLCRPGSDRTKSALVVFAHGVGRALYISAASGLFHTQILHIHAAVAHDMLSILDLQSRNYHLAIHCP